jgi:hypothetical protein
VLLAHDQVPVGIQERKCTFGGQETSILSNVDTYDSVHKALSFILCICCGVFNDAITHWGYMQSHDWMISEYEMKWEWKDVVVA